MLPCSLRESVIGHKAFCSGAEQEGERDLRVLPAFHKVCSEQFGHPAKVNASANIFGRNVLASRRERFFTP